MSRKCQKNRGNERKVRYVGESCENVVILAKIRMGAVHYLGYSTTPINPKYRPSELSKGGQFLHVPYLYCAISAMARDVVESA